MSESATASSSLFGTFLKGAGSGMFSGAVMALIMTSLTVAFTAATFATAPYAAMALLVAGTTLFGGVMGVKRAMETPATAAAPQRLSPVEEIAPTVALTPGLTGPAAAPALAEEADIDTAATSRWVDRAQRSPDRIQQILANGAMSDKDRASAILAERQTASAQANTL